MKLLILTQKIDKNDDVLGFFHRWVEEFAKHCEKITVVCLGKGKYDIPENVKVLSLGKEEGVSHARYIFRFYRHIWRERKEYDTVFVHMNQEYVLLGGLLWRAWGKKVALWRNHKKGGIFTKIAVTLSYVVFCTSPFSYTARFKKTKIMPVGIDTELFKKDPYKERQRNSILCLGRISPVKNVDVLIDALVLLDTEGVNFKLTLVGDALPKDKEYMTMLQSKAKPLLEKGRIMFTGGVPNNKTPEFYSRHEVYVNLTDSGSFDKTILEAMASECLVFVSNSTLEGILPAPFLFKEKDAHDLAQKLRSVFARSQAEKDAYGRNFRQYAMRHDLARLSKELFDALMLSERLK